MGKPVVWVFVCVTALLTCSCTSQADLAKAQADAAAARAEAAQANAALEALKAEIAKEKADAADAKRATEKAEAKAQAEVAAAREKRTKAEAELLKRWNLVAQKTPVDLTTVPPISFGMVTFTWSQFDNFPHPTFKGGSAEAYGGFAKVLVAFLQSGDNFDFLVENDLLTAELRTAVPGGSGKGTGWSFANFVEQFAAPNGYGKFDDDTRKAMKDFSVRIREVAKKPGPRKL